MFILDDENYDELIEVNNSSQAVGQVWQIKAKSQLVANRTRVAVSFKDAMGQRWERLSNGTLQKVVADTIGVNPRNLFI
jgi:hypothetical protein